MDTVSTESENGLEASPLLEAGETKTSCAFPTQRGTPRAWAWLT